jgi:predicted amidophosphoribosyltransferase
MEADTLVINHCALCGIEVEPEDEYCCKCLREVNNLEHCPCCGEIICNCETGCGD